ncbi:hypothetical protein Egran_06207, partial [Elaphomyces granulatus]
METTEHDNVITLTIDECRIEEDVMAELQEFIRLNHLGLFSEAHALFEECLSAHQGGYLAMVEYADCLLRQGLYKHLSDYSEYAEKRISSSRERQIFTLMKAIADIHRKGSLENSFRAALDVWKSLSISYTLSTEPSDIEMHHFELILQIIVAVQKNSTLFSTMLPESLEEDKIWHIFKGSFSYMLDANFAKHFWKAHRILQYLLEVVPLDEAKSLVQEYFSNVRRLKTQSDLELKTQNDLEVAVVSTTEIVRRNFVDRGIKCDRWLGGLNDGNKYYRPTDEGNLVALQHSYRHNLLTMSANLAPRLPGILPCLQRLSALQCDVMEDFLAECDIRLQLYHHFAGVMATDLSAGLDPQKTNFLNRLRSIWPWPFDERKIDKRIFQSSYDGGSVGKIETQVGHFNPHLIWLTTLGSKPISSDSLSGPDLHVLAYTENHQYTETLPKTGGPYINTQKRGTGHTALHLAAANGNKKLVQLLLREGASVQLKDWLGWTALQTAAANGHKNIVQLLLEIGDPNVQTMMLWAAEY